MSDTLLTIIPKDFYKDRCVIGYGYEVGKLRFKHIRPRLVLAPPPGGGGWLKQGAKLSGAKLSGAKLSGAKLSYHQENV